MEKGKTGRKLFAKDSFSWESKLEMQDTYSELQVYSTSMHTMSCGFNVLSRSDFRGSRSWILFPWARMGTSKDVVAWTFFPLSFI